MKIIRNLSLFVTVASFMACALMPPATAADKTATDAKAKPAPAAGKAAAPKAKSAAPTAKAPAKKKEPTYPLAKDPRPYAASPHAKNIDAGLNYLVKDESFGRWMNLAFLDMLQRKFGLHKRYSIAESFSAERRGDANTGAMTTFGRITDPGQQCDISKLPAVISMNPSISMMLKALYCDQNPVPNSYFTSLTGLFDLYLKTEPRTLDTEYGVTHAVLAYQWLKENGCMADTPGFADFQAKIAPALTDIITKGGMRRDVGYESVAMMYYAGCGDAVDKAWLDEVAAAQQADGGWAYAHDPEKGVSDGRPTVLALWALLESAVPDAPKTPMIAPASPVKPVEPVAAVEKVAPAPPKKK